MATKTQVIEQAAFKLGIMGDGQTLRASHNTDLTQAYAEVHAELEHRDYVTWDIDDAIPDQFQSVMASLVADRRRVEYMIPLERQALIQASAEDAWRTLRALMMHQQQVTTKIENF